jgi:hypothetical protein
MTSTDWRQSPDECDRDSDDRDAAAQAWHAAASAGRLYSARRDAEADLMDQTAWPHDQTSREWLATAEPRSAAVLTGEAAARDRWISRAIRGADARDMARLWYRVAVDTESAETEREAAAADREAARVLLEQAWRDRRAAADDREAAARERKAAAQDREAAAHEREAVASERELADSKVVAMKGTVADRPS